MEFLNIGVGELLVIVVIALLVFGPERLPEMARQAGRLLAQLRGASDELQRALLNEGQPFRASWEETRKEIESTAQPLEEVRKEIESTAAPLQQARQDLSGTLEAARNPFKPRSRENEITPSDANGAPASSPIVEDAILPPEEGEEHAGGEHDAHESPQGDNTLRERPTPVTFPRGEGADDDAR